MLVYSWSTSTWRPGTSGNIRSLLWLSQPFSSLCWACKQIDMHTSLFIWLFKPQKHRADCCFHVRDTFLNSHLMSHTVKNIRNSNCSLFFFFLKPRTLPSWKCTSRYISNNSFSWSSLKLKNYFLCNFMTSRAHQQFLTVTVTLITPFIHC